MPSIVFADGQKIDISISQAHKKEIKHITGPVFAIDDGILGDFHALATEERHGLRGSVPHGWLAK